MLERGTPGPSLSDERLVEECLSGGEEAWRALVDKYKNLVYNIILKYGVGSEEAADLFQTVWLEAYNDLPKLRKKSAVKAWLVSLTTHQCYHWKQKQKRRDFFESGEFSAEDLEEMIPLDPSFVEDLERDQLVREAIYRLSPRCQEMIRLLFFTSPPVPYKEVARRLGLATGSIGFIRGRCLQRLQKNLDQEGI
jgi:RNA polymerase sigma factor (sigma-70 family)